MYEIDKDTQDWLDILAGESVPDADPNTNREAKTLRMVLQFEREPITLNPKIFDNIIAELEAKEEQAPPQKPKLEISILSKFRYWLLKPAVVFSSVTVSVALVVVVFWLFATVNEKEEHIASLEERIASLENKLKEAKDDHISGWAGNDFINGNAGNDVIRGAQGNDKIYGDLDDDIYFINTCNSSLSSIENSLTAYRKRENRCEGFYRSAVSAGDIDIVGLVKGYFQFELNEKEVVEISSSVNEAIINVRAVGIPTKTYYRMDTQLVPNQKLLWHLADVIYPKELSFEQIGVFGWIGTETQKIYVPVTAKAELADVAQDEQVRLAVRTLVDVEKVTWHSSELENSKCSSFDAWKKAAGNAYYAGEPVHITLPSSRTGMLCVEVAAKEKNRGWLKPITFRVKMADSDDNK